jgi:hypothetical protein
VADSVTPRAIVHGAPALEHTQRVIRHRQSGLLRIQRALIQKLLAVLLMQKVLLIQIPPLILDIFLLHLAIVLTRRDREAMHKEQLLM